MSRQYLTGNPAPKPPGLRSEADVTARWSSDEPVVSILCPTYQHVGFIEDALHGFLGQDTDFPFEVIVRDDGSADGTAEIVRSYSQRYPNIIRALLEIKNSWPDTQPLQVLAPLARGRFVALCEGDDYWLDPQKLAKQVNHLERTPTAVVSHHQSLVVEDGRITSPNRLAASEQVDLDAAALRRGGRLLTNTLLYRNGVIANNAFASGRYPSGIKFLRVAFGLVGDGVFTDDVLPAVYRRHSGGISSGAHSLQHQLDIASSHYLLCDFLARHGDLASAEVHARKSVKALQQYFRSLGVAQAGKDARFRINRARSWTPWSR